jgi:spoIIIJ-associated protein
MRIVEVSGKTVEEAVARALEQLALSPDQVDVDVISEGKRGVFGIGQEPAIVRVSAKVTAATQYGQATPRPARPPRQRGGGGQRREDAQESSRSRNGQPARNGRGGGRAATGERPPRGEGAPRRGTGEVGPPVLVPGAPTTLPVAPLAEAEDEVDFAGRTIRDILTLLGLTETEIAARDPESAGDGVGLVTQIFDIYGNDEDASQELGLLIGRRGDTLASLQYVLNVLVSTRYGNDHVFAVDIDQYKHRREQTLVDMAKRIAAEVRETGDVITLEPMPAAERRIIHVTLAEEPGVRTESVGQGYNRQVEVLPDDR